MTLTVEKFQQAFNALINNNGLIVIAIFVVVIHGFTTKLVAWISKKVAKKGKKEEFVKVVKDKNEDENDGHNHPLPDAHDSDMISYKPQTFSESEMKKRSEDFYEQMNKRRSVRFFSDKKVPLEIIQNCIKTAGTSPSGAHTQPWTYAIIQDPQVKAKIKDIIEEEEEINYKKRMAKTWVEDLKKFKTSWKKPYLANAPYLILVFKQAYGLTEAGERITHYYNETSIGISCGLLLAAIQNAGLTALTSTPMNAGPALRQMLNRGKNEKLLLLIPVGYAADDCVVPDIQRKPLEEIMVVV